MTDLEITKRCAEAMGMRQFEYFPPGDYPDQHGTYEISGDEIYRLSGNSLGGYNRYPYDPLHDDAQAMALVKKFDLNIIKSDDEWWVHESPHICDYIATAERHDVTDWGAYDKDLNRAICECVAKMGEAK